MLVLSRKENESIVARIDGRLVRITVTEIRGDKVRLGIEAPREIEVDREEVFQRKLAEQGRGSRGEQKSKGEGLGARGEQSPIADR